MGKLEDKSKPEDRRKEYIKEKIKKYGENWKEHIKFVEYKNKPTPIKRERPQKTQTYKGGGLAGMRRFNKGGKV